jgi:DNA repair protein RadA/Sms
MATQTLYISENRLKEAQKLGFCQALAPAAKKLEEIAGITLRPMDDLAQFVEDLFGSR